MLKFLVKIYMWIRSVTFGGTSCLCNKKSAAKAAAYSKELLLMVRAANFPPTNGNMNMPAFNIYIYIWHKYGFKMVQIQPMMLHVIGRIVHPYHTEYHNQFVHKKHQNQPNMSNEAREQDLSHSIALRAAHWINLQSLACQNTIQSPGFNPWRSRLPTTGL